MPANSNEPFKRVGSNSWQELLDQVNEELQSPPEDTQCEPINPITPPAENHRWAKSDIQEVHDKLNQMPTNCFTFQSIPDLWKTSIIEDIENQLGNTWCDCENDEICCFPCPNCGSSTTEFLFEFDTNQACRDANANDGCVDNCESDELNPILTDYFDAKDRYRIAACDFCRFSKELEVLEGALETLQDQLALLQDTLNNCPAGGEGAACRAAAQAAIDAKQTEIDDKQTEIDNKTAQKATALSDRTTARVDLITFGNQTLDAGDSCVQGYESCNSLLPGNNVPARSDGNCDELPDDCCGCDPLECELRFSIQRQTTREGGFTFVGGWITIGNGNFNIDGSPVWTNWRGDCCLQVDATCSSTDCSQGGCSACNCNYLYAYRLILRPESCFTEFDCINGGQCDGDGGS